MEKSMNDYVVIYKTLLEQGDVQTAYVRLVSYMKTLKAHCARELSGAFSFGALSPGYMDYTYFPFFNPFLRDRRLRFGIVLNHASVRFELWLMGQNADV